MCLPLKPYRTPRTGAHPSPAPYALHGPGDIPAPPTIEERGPGGSDPATGARGQRPRNHHYRTAPTARTNADTPRTTFSRGHPTFSRTNPGAP